MYQDGLTIYGMTLPSSEAFEVEDAEESYERSFNSLTSCFPRCVKKRGNPLSKSFFELQRNERSEIGNVSRG